MRAVGTRRPAPQAQPSHAAQSQCFDPLTWETFYDERHFAEEINGSGRFCYYTKETKFADGDDNSAAPLVFLIHGGGFSGLSWGAMCASLTAKAACRCVAMDVRGHGDTEVEPSGDGVADRHSEAGKKESLDFSLDALAGDAAALLHRLDSPSPLILIGHSMGGAVATHLAAHGSLLDESISISALVVIDVVEGSAMEALSGMRTYLGSRPSRFPTLQSAIQWCYRSGTVRNLESARVSFPGHLKLVQPPAVASAAPAEEPLATTSSPKTCSAIQEEEEPEEEAEEEGGGKTAAVKDGNNTERSGGSARQLPRIGLRGPALLQPRASKPPLPQAAVPAPSYRASGTAVDPTKPFYTWRIDLSSTEDYWSDWFTGMSRKFLDAPAVKLLLLAGVDRLDRELTVGQMQGRFQMQVLPRSGHAVHEDHPEHVAEVIASFLVRHKLVQPLTDFHPVPPGC